MHIPLDSLVRPSLFGLFAFSRKLFKNEEGSCIFPFSCTRFSTFPVRLFEFSHKRFKNEEGSCSISFYLPCLVYLLSLTSALRTRKVHVYFLSPVHAFLPSLFGLFAFSPESALRTRKVHVYFLSPVHAFSAFPVRSHHYSTRSCVSNKSTSSKSGRLQDRRFESNRVDSTNFSALPVSQIDFRSVESTTTQTIRVELS